MKTFIYNKKIDKYLRKYYMKRKNNFSIANLRIDFEE